MIEVQEPTAEIAPKISEAEVNRIEPERPAGIESGMPESEKPMDEDAACASCGEIQNCQDSIAERPAGATGPVTVLEFETIARGAKFVCVTYRGQCYQLRSTRNGKLILNK